MDRIRSLEDLEKARKEALTQETGGMEPWQFQIRVSLGSCSIAAGANETLEAINQFISANQLKGVQTKVIGCIGLCALEPIIQIVEADQVITYGKVLPPVVQRIFNEHIEKHLIVQEYVVENI